MTKTGAKGKLSRQVSYEVKLFIAASMRSRWRSMYRIRKPDAKGRYGRKGEVRRKENLLTLNKPLRLYIFDNTTWDGNPPSDKEKFYKNRKLKGPMNVFVPLRLEVKKYISNKEVRMDRHDDVKAVFEIEDPSEELSIINGPRHSNPHSRTGRKFVESLKKRTQLGGSVGKGDDDNCIRAFAPGPFQSRCRRKGSKIKAPDVLWKRGKGKKGKYVGPLSSHSSNANLAVAPINWRRQRVLIGFHPPPILGNNYRLKVNLIDQKGKYLFTKAFCTPTITVWRRIKIQLVARQEGIKVKAIKWKEVKDAYLDAFIHLAGPRKNDNLVISKKKWIEYLDKHVYTSWLPTEWQRYKTLDGGNALDSDITSYSFPQATELEESFNSNGVKTSYKLKEKPMQGSVQVLMSHRMKSTALAENTDFIVDYNKNSIDFFQTHAGASFAWAPPRGAKIFVRYFTHKGIETASGKTLTPLDESKTNPNHTSLELLKKLTDVIVKKNLPRRYKGKINDVKKGARIGVCVLVCYHPNPNPKFAGSYLASLGGKRFVLNLAVDATKTFVHEMGHALFLKHGATKFIFEKNKKKQIKPIGGLRYQKKPKKLKPIIVRSVKSGSEGPYWDQHDSEDTISCIMSYENNYYDKKGKRLKKNATDWHFCGVCLLLLRFYSKSGMSESRTSPESFRRVNYYKKPQIAYALEMKMRSEYSILSWDFVKSMTVPAIPPRLLPRLRDPYKRRLLAVYPRELVKNNSGKRFWKDIGHHPRGKWVSSLPGKAKVIKRKRGDIQISELVPINPTEPRKPVRIEFQMFHGPGSANVIKSKPLKVTVTR